MAKIILEPGETFEHSHTGSSNTKLIAGALEVEFGNHSQRLAPGQSITVPAHTPHTLRNCAEGESVIQCEKHIRQ